MVQLWNFVSAVFLWQFCTRMLWQNTGHLKIKSSPVTGLHIYFQFLPCLGSVRINPLPPIDPALSYADMPNPVSFRYFKTSHEIIQLAVMLYVRFIFSLKNVEDLLRLREPWKRQKVSIRSAQLRVILGLVFSPV
jgi:hypothetical protein